MESSEVKKKKKINYISAGVNGALLLLLVLAINPGSKAFIIRSLMHVGFFKPALPAKGQVGIKSSTGSFFGTFDTKRGQVSLEAAKGKIVFLNFWATWCPPCQAEMPSVNALHNVYKNDTNIVFLIVDADGNSVKAEDFMTTHKYELPVAVQDGKISPELYSGTLPTTVVLDRAGRIALKHEGYANYDAAKMHRFIDYLSKRNTDDTSAYDIGE